LAATYAGGVEQEILEEIVRGADIYRHDVAQGAAFAAKARQLAECSTEATENACRIFCGVSADEAARWTDEALVDLPASDEPLEPQYESWRRRIAERYRDHIQSKVG
jgi:hypothetical protein